MFKKILTLTAASAMLLGLPLMAAASGPVNMTGTTNPTVTNGSLKTNAIVGIVAHGQNAPLAAPIIDPAGTKGNIITAVLPPVAGKTIRVFVGGSRSDSVIGVNLLTWHF